MEEITKMRENLIPHNFLKVGPEFYYYWSEKDIANEDKN
jgi:hypothetical protein